MTNKEWLDYLAHNAPDELAAWFDAERTESLTSETMQHIGQVIENTIKLGVYGDAAAQNADSRDKLEADAKRYIEHAADYAYEDVLWADETFTLYDAIIELLDRQAEIIRAEDEAYCQECNNEQAKRVCELEAQIAELTAERDNLKANNEQLHTLAGEQAAKIDELQAQADEKWNLYVAEHRRADSNAADREMYSESTSALLDCITEGLTKVDAILGRKDEGLA